MIIFTFTKFANKRFLKLSSDIQERIIKKLQELKNQENIFGVLRILRDFNPATHRLRIGNYRLILELKNQAKDQIEFWILDVDHRKDIYK